jgi:hypothetical protein
MMIVSWVFELFFKQNFAIFAKETYPLIIFVFAFCLYELVVTVLIHYTDKKLKPVYGWPLIAAFVLVYGGVLGLSIFT